MALTDTAELLVKLTLAGNFTKQLGLAQKDLKSFDRQIDSTQGRAYKAGTQIGTGIKRGATIAAAGVAFLASQVVFGLKQLAQLEALTAQTNAVLKSTGSVAGITAGEVRNLAEKYENLNAIIDDKVIQSGENLLLTFTNIKKQAFEPTLQAALDMSTALGQDLNTSVLQLGKALSDPAKGLLALRRAGVIFSKDQEKRIKTLQKEGKLWEAQQVILAEVGKEFGGSFAAQGKTAEGAIAGIGDAVEDLQKSLATALFPTIQKVLPQIRAFLISPAFTKGAEDLGKAIAGVFSDENIASAGEIIESVFRTAQAAAPVVAAAAKTMAGIVQTAVSVFRSLPPEIQSLAVGAFAVNKLTGGLVTNVAGGIAGSVISAIMKNMSAGVVNVEGAVVNVAGGVGGGVPGAAGAATGGAAGLVKGALSATVILGIATIIGQAIVDATGGPNAGKGRPLGNTGIQVGVSQAALVHPLDQINANTKMIGHYTSDGASAARDAAARAVVTNERLEAIRGQEAASRAAAIGDSASERAAIAASHAGIVARLAGDTASEQATIRSAAAAQSAAVRAAGADTRAETAGVRRAVEAKKLNVDVKVVNQNKVSVQQIVKQTVKINQYTTIS